MYGIDRRLLGLVFNYRMCRVTFYLGLVIVIVMWVLITGLYIIVKKYIKCFLCY